MVDVEAQRFRKFERKRVVLQRGFFTEKAKPFKTVGVVHIDDGDLILSGITDEFKARVSCYRLCFNSLVHNFTLYLVAHFCSHHKKAITAL